VKRALALLLLLVGCTTVPSADGFPVIQSRVAGHTMSCKGTRCCWPWSDHPNLVICVEPLEGGYLGAGGVLVTVRGRMP